MHLISFVIAGQCVHHPVDPESVGHLALAFAAWHDGGQRSAELVDRPGARKIIGADDDRRDAVVMAAATSLDPQRAACPPAGKIIQQIERLGENVIRRRLG